MHALIFRLFIVSVAASAPTTGIGGDAQVVFEQRFDVDALRTYDNWPPGWARQRGADYPPYLSIEISPDKSPTGPGSLKMELNGGGAILYSPEIAINAEHSYQLDAMIQTAGLRQDSAFVSITLLGEDRAPLTTYRTRLIGKTTPWTSVSLGPLTLEHRSARWMLIGLHLEPTGKLDLWHPADLTGTAWFDNIRVTQLPALRMDADRPLHLYRIGEPVSFKCRLSGYDPERTTLTLQLLNAFGDEVGTPYQTDVADLRQPTTESSDSGQEPLDPNAHIAHVRWRQDNLPAGFYQLRGVLDSDGSRLLEQTITLAVLKNLFERTSQGHFGWSLSSRQHQLQVEPLARLLVEAGLHCAKIPAWLDSSDPAAANELVWFSQRLQSLRIEPVGLLMDPPQPIRTALIDRQLVPATSLQNRAPTAAETFALPPEVWYPEVEYTLTQLSTLIRWWQLGSDDDRSMMDESSLTQKVTQVKKALDRIGEDFNIGLAWDWLRPLPDQHQAVPWRFLTMSAQPSLAPNELEAYLKAERPRGVERWVSLSPLAADAYDLEQRVLDLVHRMLIARSQGAERVFVNHPFDANQGLVHRDGTPGALFVPWRTVAQAISGADYLGALELPGGSPNQVYRRGDELVLVVWNSVETTDVVYSGPKTNCLNVWGQTLPVEPTHDGGQRFAVGPWPVIVRSRDVALISSQLSFELARTKFPPDLGQTYDNELRLQNEFTGGATGTVSLVLPDRWKATPSQFALELTPGQSWQQPFKLRIPYDADTGRQVVRVDIELMADRPLRYSIYRTLTVGEDNLQLEVATRQLPGRGTDGRTTHVQSIGQSPDFDLRPVCSRPPPDATSD